MKILSVCTALLLAITLTFLNLSVALAAGPSVTGVISSLPDGSYTTGQLVPVQVIFSDVVIVTGTPQLTLATGSPSKTAVNYSSGSGTTTLTFNYTVAAGNTSADLDYVKGNPLVLNGGTITDAAANSANLKLPNPGSTGSLGANKNIIIDTAPPSVTINQAVGQLDPTSTSPINLTVVFSEVVTDFISGDVTLSGTAGATTASVTGGPITYNVAVTGMSTSGTVIASLAPGVAHDAAGNPNNASTSSDDTVTYNRSTLTVSINQAAAQPDPTNTSPINFTVVFSEAVTDFTTGDVTLGGTAGATTAIVTGSGTTYNVAVSGLTTNGTVIASIAAGVAHDTAGSPNIASTSTDNIVTYNTSALIVTINQAAAQLDPTNASPINFTVVFSEVVTDFATGDVTLGGTAGATTAIVSGSGTSYNVAVSGMTISGTVIASIAAGVAHNAANQPNTASTSSDNTVTYDTTALTVTINQAAAQADPTSTSPVNFTVIFNKATTDFATGDVTLSGTAGATTAIVTGSGTTYNVAVSSITSSGTVIASIAPGVAHDSATNPNIASTSTDNTVTYNLTFLAVTINQAAAQLDPTNASPINFTVIFNEVVTDFATGDVTLGGTAGATTAIVSGIGTSYNVAVSGMTTSGTVIASIAAGVAHDAANRSNTASTSADNSVNYDTTPLTVTINQAAAQADPTNISPINFTVIFNKATTDFATGDITLGGTTSATMATVTGGPTTYNVAVTGMAANGTVIASIGPGVAHDAAGNPNVASTSTDNTVTYNISGLTVSINQAAGQLDPTNSSPINFTVVFNEVVTDFATGDVTLGGTAGATTATVTGSGTTYNVAVSGMTTTTSGTVIASIAAGVAHDYASNPNANAAFTDNSVTYDKTWPSISWIAPQPCSNPPGCLYSVFNQSITLTVDASDNVGIASLEFRRWDYVNNTWMGIWNLL